MSTKTVIGICVLLLVSQLNAQWVTCTHSLTQGWNAVWMSVQPVPSDCDTVFGSQPSIDQVCTYQNTFTPVQFVDSLSDLNPTNSFPGWLRWQPGGNTFGAARSLYAARAGRAYLVHASNSCLLTVVGRPSNPPLDWRPSCLNIVGFQFANAPATFAAFFADDPNLIVTNIYRLSASGAWTGVTSPSSTAMRSGEAFWIRTSGLPTFQGHPVVTYPVPASLDFGATAMELALSVATSGVTSVSVEKRPTVACTNAPEYAAYAGPITNALAVWNPEGSGSWWFLTNGLAAAVDLRATAGSLRFAVFRHKLPKWNGAGTPLFADIVRLGVPGGNTVDVPVSVYQEPSLYTDRTSPLGCAGLWVGEVAVCAVGRPIVTTSDGATNGPVHPLPVDSANPFRFRILMHAGTDSAPRLLRQAVLGWVPPVYGPPDDNGFRKVSTNGHHVLCDRAARLDAEGAEFVTRISTPVFGFDAPLAPVSTTTNALRYVLATPPDHDLHPYRHAAHPEHDGKKQENGETVVMTLLTSTHAVTQTNHLGEVWSCTHTNLYNSELSGFTRSIELTFSDLPTATAPAWRHTELAGIWSEVITGLHHEPIRVEGLFSLRRVAAVADFLEGEGPP